MEPDAAAWTLPIRGESMRLLLKAGDLILVRRAGLEELRPGDLTVFLDCSGGAPNYVVHRLLARFSIGGKRFALTKGDSNFLPDPLAPESSIVGVVAALRMGDRWHGLGPSGRPGGFVLAAASPLLYWGVSLAYRACSLAQDLSRLPMPRAGRDALLSLLAAFDRLVSGVSERLGALAAGWVLDGEVPPPAVPARVVLGILDSNQTWSGRVQVDGDVYVPVGVTLRIQPGTEVLFREESQWDCLREYPALGSFSAGLDGRCRLAIGGRLCADGTPQAPIRFGGAPWGGIHFLADSRGSRLAHAELSGSVKAAVSLWGGTQAELLSVSIRDSETGLDLAGRNSRALLDECRIEGCRRYGMASAGGALTVRRTTVSDCGQIAVYAEGGAQVELEDCVLLRAPVGLGLRGGRLKAAGLRVEAAGRAGLELDGDAHELSRVAVVDCGTGMIFGGRRLDAEDVEILRCASAIVQRAGSSRWTRGRAEGGRFGLELTEGRAEISDFDFAGQTVLACSVEKGVLSLRRSRIRAAGLSVRPGAEASLEDVSLEEGKGHPVDVEDGSVTARGLRVRDWPQGGLRACRPRRLEVTDAAVAGCLFGVDLSGGRSDLKDVSFGDCAQASVRASAGADLRWAGGRAERGRVGLDLSDGRAVVAGVSFEECEEASVRASAGADLRWEDGRVEGGCVGLDLSDGRAVVAVVSFERLRTAACRVERGSLSLRGAHVRGGGGITLGPGSQASLEDVRLDEGTGHPLSVEDAELVAGSTSVRGWPEGGLLAQRPRRLDLSEVTVTGCRFGVAVFGGRAGLRALSVSDCAEIPFAAEAGASVRADGLSVQGGLDGVVVRDSSLEAQGLRVASPRGAGLRAAGSRVELRRALFDEGEAGLLAENGSTILEDCHLRGQAGLGVYQRGGELSLNGCVLEGPGTGVTVASGRLDMENCRLSGAAMALECGGEAFVSGLTLDGGAGGVLCAGSSFELSRAELRDCAGGVDVRSGRLAWRGGSLSGGGLRIGRGAEASIEDVSIERVPGHGARVTGGRLFAADCRWRDLSEIAVLVEDEGSASLERCLIRRARSGVMVASGTSELTEVRISEAAEVGVSLAAGRHRLSGVTFHGCTDRIHAADGAYVDSVAEVPSAGVFERFSEGSGRSIRSLVLRTRHFPPFALAYRAVYSVPVLWLRLCARFDPAIQGLFIHRGWARKGWEPGTSDIDLVVLARELSGDRGRLWLAGFWRRYLALKRVFPFLGECILAEAGELRAYQRWGGFRARDASLQLRRLHGPSLEEPVRSQGPSRGLELFGEDAHAYTRLMADGLWKTEDSALGVARVENAVLDLLRTAALRDGEGPLDLPRRDRVLAMAGTAAEPFRGPLRELRRSGDAGARATLCAAALGRLHDEALGVLSAWPSAAPTRLRWEAPAAETGAAAVVELNRRRVLRDVYARAAGEGLIAGCVDDIYRSCLILDDAAAAPGALARTFSGLARLAAESGEPATLPIVLTRSAWRVWSRLAYLEAPLRFFETGAMDGDDALRRAGGLWPCSWQYCWGRSGLEAVSAPDGLVLDAARESLATLRWIWRFQASEASGLSRGYVSHYLLGRVLGLRLLLEKGVGASFFALDGLRELYIREFPERAGALESLWGVLAERGEAASWRDCYAWVDAELREADASVGAMP